MILLALLALPALIGIAGRLIWSRRITWKEVAVHEVVVIAIIGIGYAIGRADRKADTEIWNGSISRKWTERVGCCHSYSCNPHMCIGTCLDAEGHVTTCVETCWDTCYHHKADVAYHAVTSNREPIFDDGCYPPDDAPPARWTAIVESEPTAIEHAFENYIKAAPGAFPWKRDLAEQYRAQIPAYPRVSDIYRVQRVFTQGVTIPDVGALNDRLSAINANLGARKQVNIILVVTSAKKPEYADALSAAWLGGKKNDLIVVVGLPSGSEIAWVRVISWTEVTAVKEGIEKGVLHLGMFKGQDVLRNIGEVSEQFIRRPMAKFAYLKASIEPTPTALWTLFAIGLLLALGLQWFFWTHDPFGEE
ncbi:MAG: hypothetical protein Q7S02_01160 [bacterium]|nr:hypothetical protein [bacterium]